MTRTTVILQIPLVPLGAIIVIVWSVSFVFLIAIISLISAPIILGIWLDGKDYIDEAVRFVGVVFLTLGFMIQISWTFIT